MYLHKGACLDAVYDEYSNIFYRRLDIQKQILKFSTANIFGYSNIFYRILDIQKHILTFLTGNIFGYSIKSLR